MAVKGILKYGDPILRKRCKNVEDFGTISNLVEDMFDTMYEEDGIGLASNQIGENLHLFVIDISHTDENEEPRIFINSSIQKKNGECLLLEGCLSIPGIQVEVKRSESVTLKYSTLDGSEKEEEFDGLLARAIQHEIDHLNGIFIVDRLSDLAKMQFKKELKSIKNEAVKKSTMSEQSQGIVL